MNGNISRVLKAPTKPILDLAIARFRAFEKMRNERDEAVAALEDRKLIERAKGILVSHIGLSEAEAFKYLRDQAMSRNQTMPQIAAKIIHTKVLFEKQGSSKP